MVASPGSRTRHPPIDRQVIPSATPTVHRKQLLGYKRVRIYGSPLLRVVQTDNLYRRPSGVLMYLLGFVIVVSPRVYPRWFECSSLCSPRDAVPLWTRVQLGESWMWIPLAVDE